MKYLFLLIILSIQLNAQNDSVNIRKIYDYHLSQSNTYKNEEYLATKIGGRLSGSPQAAKAVEWAKKAMYEAGADTVYLMPCMVPHWVRGEKEQCKLVSKKIKSNTHFSICALGGSIATPANGITAEVIEVTSFDELKSLGADKVKGKIVFYNVPMNPKHINTGKAYGEAVKYRSNGAKEAARLGALASITRSMTLTLNDVPHTGAMHYDSLGTKIPSCAISTIGANQLSELLKQDAKLQLFIKMNCQTLAEEPSFNVVGEIKGSEKPDEIIVVGGHLDSWDLGQGAHDDGTGVVQSIEVLAGFKKAGIQPKRTIRAIAYMNEENGARGGKAYTEYSKKNKLKHIAALESDGGGFAPSNISIDAENNVVEKFKQWQALFAPYNINIVKGHSGVDVGFLKEVGTICMSLNPDSQRYFDIHHTADDTFDKVNKRELELGAAAMNAFIYLLDKYGVN